jgi:hypothetical protein
MPKNLMSIDQYAFNDCSSLTSVTIPNIVTSIGDWAFSGCSRLTNVIVKIKTPVEIDRHTFSGSWWATLYVPSGCKAAYEAADYWKDFKIVEDAEATVIAVETRIICIGAVGYTDECKERIDIARSLYDSLSKDKQALVSNYNVLTAAEEEYNFLAKSASGIDNMNSDSSKKDGKYLVNGKVVIVKNGKKFNVNGLAE